MNGEVTVATAAEMRALGRRLAALLRAGDVVILSGPLGAGKTTLTQGIGAGLGVRGPVTSPTFVIARVHPSLARAQGLAEGLAADRLEIAITPDNTALEGDDTALERDAPRTVMIAGVGRRWHGIELPPADLADRL